MTGLPVRSTIAGLAAGAALLLGGAAPAMAESVGTLTISSGLMHQYTVSPASSSDIRLSYESPDVIYEDRGVSRIVPPTNFGRDCRVGARPNILRCTVGDPLSGFPFNVSISLNDGDDRVVMDSSLPPMGSRGSISIWTRDGADTIVQPGPTTAFSIDAGPGYDTFVGGSGDDRFRGGTGNDVFNGGRGADTFDGGEGVDQISYLNEGRTSGVRVNLSDSSVKSGSQGPWDGDGDFLGGVEEAVGTPYTDVITGSAGDDYLFGEGGSDRIDGLGGNDEIWAPGGPSWVDGGDGNDTIHAKNSAKDFLSCGAGTDTVFLDSSETFVPFSACETLKP